MDKSGAHFHRSNHCAGKPFAPNAALERAFGQQAGGDTRGELRNHCRQRRQWNLAQLRLQLWLRMIEDVLNSAAQNCGSGPQRDPERCQLQRFGGQVHDPSELGSHRGSLRSGKQIPAMQVVDLAIRRYPEQRRCARSVPVQTEYSVDTHLLAGNDRQQLCEHGIFGAPIEVQWDAGILRQSGNDRAEFAAGLKNTGRLEREIGARRHSFELKPPRLPRGGRRHQLELQRLDPVGFLAIPGLEINPSGFDAHSRQHPGGGFIFHCCGIVVAGDE